VQGLVIAAAAVLAPCVLGVAPPAVSQARWTTAGAVRIRYFEAGSGPPMLLLHGFGGSATNWFCAMEALGAKHRVIAIDQAGFGASEKPRRAYGGDFLAESAHAFLRTLGVTHAVVAGASMGGDVAARLAARHPGDVAKLILVDSSGLDLTPRKSDFPRDPHTLAEQEQILRAIFADPAFVTPALVRQRLRAHLRNGDSYTLTHWTGDDVDLESLLPKIQAPTLVLWGSDDPIWPRATAREYARRIAHAEIAVIENAGHAPYLERPASFVDAVLRFTARSPAPSPP
jgi:pimeloyl-ACP methyl ester carboxylesterase